MAGSCVKSSQVSGLRTRTASVPTLILSPPPSIVGYDGDPGVRPLATVSKYKYQIELRKYVMQSIWDLGLGKPVLRHQIDKKPNRFLFGPPNKMKNPG